MGKAALFLYLNLSLVFGHNPGHIRNFLIGLLESTLNKLEGCLVEGQEARTFEEEGVGLGLVVIFGSKQKGLGFMLGSKQKALGFMFGSKQQAFGFVRVGLGVWAPTAGDKEMRLVLYTVL